MRPLLQAVQDGNQHKMRDLYARLAAEFRLTEAEMAEMLPSERQATYKNRIGWARTYLTKAKALESPQRGIVRITERGKALLSQYPQGISTKLLMTFPEFAQFQGVQLTPRQGSTPQIGPQHIIDVLSPEEQLDTLYAALNAKLAEDLLDQLMKLSPSQFEVLVVRLLVAMGYGGSTRDAGEALGKSGDNGVDGVVKQDPLGLDKVYLQAKRWQDNVGSQEVRNFAGSLSYHKASKGVFITTSEFSSNAKNTAQQIGNIILIGGQRLSQLMIEYGIGVINRAIYQVKRIDSEFFEEI